MDGFTAGIVIAVVLVVGFIALLVWGVKSGAKRERKERKLLAQARPAVATVTAIEATPILRGMPREPMVMLTLEIRPERAAPYSTETVWFVDTVAVPRIQPGQEVPVKVDAHDPRIAYPAEPWAVYGWGFEKAITLMKQRKS
jgi:hypothetical protein